MVNLISAGLAIVIARAFSRRDKRRSAVLLFVSGLALSCSPMVLRLAGLFPANGAPIVFPTLLSVSLLSLAPMVAASILTSSMIADVVEDSQLRTGRRSEGLFFAANSFVQKAVSGIGVFLSGVILSLAHFPQTGALQAGTPVDAEIVRNLALLYLPIVVGLYLISMVLLRGYRINRETHEANLRALAER